YFRFFFSSRRRHTRSKRDWSSDVCSSDLFSNILSNAVAYTLPGSSIFVRIDNRKLIVENECEPIPAEHLKHIFEPFYRPDYARNQNYGGNGHWFIIIASVFDYL